MAAFLAVTIQITTRKNNLKEGGWLLSIVPSENPIKAKGKAKIEWENLTKWKYLATKLEIFLVRILLFFRQFVEEKTTLIRKPQN
jgi:hypothetical protein